jgi:hypothetical protein
MIYPKLSINIAFVMPFNCRMDPFYLYNSMKMYILSHVLVTEAGFGLVIGFISTHRW